MELGYYPGCTLHSSSSLYDVQSKIVLEELGISLKEIDDWNCCGATSASKTDDFMAIAMPARNLGLAEAAGMSELVIPCSACYSRMLVAQARQEEVTTGLIVDQVSGIRYLAVGRIGAPAAPIEDQVTPYLRGVYEHDGRLLVVLDFDRLLLSPEMRQFEPV